MLDATFLLFSIHAPTWPADRGNVSVIQASLAARRSGGTCCPRNPSSSAYRRCQVPTVSSCRKRTFPTTSQLIPSSGAFARSPDDARPSRPVPSRSILAAIRCRGQPGGRIEPGTFGKRLFRLPGESGCSTDQPGASRRTAIHAGLVGLGPGFIEEDGLGLAPFTRHGAGGRLARRRARSSFSRQVKMCHGFPYQGLAGQMPCACPAARTGSSHPGAVLRDAEFLRIGQRCDRASVSPSLAATGEDLGDLREADHQHGGNLSDGQTRRSWA